MIRRAHLSARLDLSLQHIKARLGPPRPRIRPTIVLGVRVLHLTPRVPWPPLRGDQLIFFHRLRTLADRHDLSLITLYSDPEELAGLEHVRPYCSQIETVRLRRRQGMVNAVRGAAGPLPLQVAYHRSPELRRRLAVRLEEGFDVVHAYFLRLAPYLEDVKTPRVLELMDSLELRLAQQAATDRRPLRWLWREELRRIRPYERSAGRLADHLIVVSERDRMFFPAPKTSVVVNGVDYDVFAPQADVRRADRVVFSGNMGYAPNVQGALWFASECWPSIRAAVPTAQFAIVGARPSRDVRALGGDGIEITGYVDSIALAINEAAVSVAPLRSGSGMQNKILEAMACARPVVTTSVGRGSIAATPGESIVVADDAETFAAAVVDLLRDPARGDAIGRSGREYVRTHHSWERGADLVDDIYRRIT